MNFELKMKMFFVIDVLAFAQKRNSLQHDLRERLEERQRRNRREKENVKFFNEPPLHNESF